MEERTETRQTGTQAEPEGMQGNSGTQSADTAGKTFTQEDVNRIVQERLAKEKSRGTEELDKRAAELDRRERKLNAVAELRKNGLPDYLADVLDVSADETLRAGIDAVLRMKKESMAEEPQVIRKVNLIGGVPMSGSYQNDSLRDAFGLK